MKKEVTMVIDGPNLINRIIDLEINKNYIIDQFSLENLRTSINNKLRELNYEYVCDIVEFICSRKVFGSGENRFSLEERNKLINRFKRGKGIYVKEINLSGNAEKGVDVKVALELKNHIDQDGISILISADKDYVPILEQIREERKKVITVSFDNKFPIEIQNTSYVTLDMGHYYRDFFIYRYPEYNIETITLDEFKNMYANADDRKNNQLRVYKSGDVFISHEHTASENISFLKFRWETYNAFNEYVGPKAATDNSYMEKEYETLKKDWECNRRGYIDYKI